MFRKQLNEKISRIVFVCVMLFFEIGYHIWLVANQLWDASHALPLQLCSVSLILCILLLLTNNKVIFEIVYFIGIAGAIQAILTPELFYNFPHFRFFHFFVNHSLIIWTCLFYVWTVRYKITLSSIFKSLVFLQIVAFIAFIANICYWWKLYVFSRQTKNELRIRFFRRLSLVYFILRRNCAHFIFHPVFTFCKKK